MLQQVMTSPGEIVFREVETPVPQAGEVLIRMMRIGIPRTVGMQYRRAFQSVREALCGNGIPVWFCLAWNLLGLDSSLFTSISSGALFQARNNCVRKRKKPSSLRWKNGLILVFHKTVKYRFMRPLPSGQRHRR